MPLSAAGRKHFLSHPVRADVKLFERKVRSKNWKENFNYFDGRNDLFVKKVGQVVLEERSAR